MASGGAEEDNGGIPLDIDNVHMLLQVEHEQIQKRTFTNWVNAQLAKKCPPSFVSDLFSDLRDGSQLLDLLEVMSSQPMKRQKGRGVFQQRANIETALNFLKRKSIKLVNINIPDIIDGRPSIILGLIWTIILHCHIEELASTLSYSSCHSSLDSLASLDSWSGSPVPASPAPAGRTSPLHRRFRLSAKKALLMWVRDQCLKVGCSISVKNFKSSWRSGEAFLAILCSLRPELLDLSLVQLRSNQENLEEAFHLAERELHIPRLLEPQDVDVKDPEEKSIMTYVAQFLQYSNDMPAPDDHLQLFPLVQPFSLSPVNLPAHFTPALAVSPLRQVSSSERALEVTSWLQQAYQELSEARTATEKSSFSEKYHVLQSLAGSFTEQRRPVMTLLAAIRRRPELSREQSALRTAWDRLEKELQSCKVDLDSSLPPPLDSVLVWLQRAEASLTEEGGRVKDHADAAKEARAQQDTQKTLMKEISHFVNIIDTFHNIDDLGNILVPLEKFDDIKRCLTEIRVTAKYQGIKLEYQETHHTVLDLLGRISAKVLTWKASYRSQETVLLLLQDWHETVERHGLLLILMDALQNLKERAATYTSKAALGEDSQLVTRQVTEAESEAERVTQAVTAVRGLMERAVSAWETYNQCLTSLQTWLAQTTLSHAQSPPGGTKDMSEWTSCHAKLNEAGNALIEVTEASTSRALAEQLSKVNMNWAECMKRTKFDVSSEPNVGPQCLQMVHSLTQEASRLLKQPLEVASVPLKANRQKLQLLSKKMAEMDLSSLSPSSYFQTGNTENLQQNLPQMLDEAERTCGELQRAASRLEGRLAELDHWSTEAVDCYQHLREKEHRGRSALESAAKVLIPRGVHLEKQVATEGQDLQDLVARVQKTSPLQHLSTSGTQDRISEAVSHCQEILGLFSSLGVLQHIKTAHQTQRQPEAGLFVVAKTKVVDQIGSVMLPQDTNLVSPETSSETPQRTRALWGWPKTQHVNTQDESTIVKPRVEIQTLPRSSRDPMPHIHSPLPQTVKEAESEPMIQPQSLSKCRSQDGELLPTTIQTPAGPKCQKSPVLSEHVTISVPEEEGSSSPSQTRTWKSRIRGQPITVQGAKTSPQPPVMVHSEVHSKAHSMARSRLEKARFRVQGRIQQAIRLFGGKEISESQAKRKQRALKMLQPAILDEFLGAVEGLGAFCTGPQLQDLMLLSASVRKQWEDVRREMAAFVPNLWSKIREGKPSSLQCETQTNALHKSNDQTDHDSLLQQQAVMDGAALVEVESLRALCETLTPGQSSCPATEQLKESDEDQETQPCDTALPSECRGLQLRGNTPLRATGVPADTPQSNDLPQKQSVATPQRDRSPACGAAASVQPRGDVIHVQYQDVPTECEDDPTQRPDCGSTIQLNPSLLAKEQQLKARLLRLTESNQQARAHIQVVVRGNTVVTKQQAEWTVIPVSAALPQEEHSSKQEVLERYRKSCLVFQFQLQKNKQHLEEFISDPITISTLQNQKKQLQTLKRETEALWLDCELQYTQHSQLSHLMTREDKGDLERDWEQLNQQWRGQQMCLQSRMTSLDSTADLMALITEKLDQIIRESVDISSFTIADSRLTSDLKEIDDRLQSEMRTLSERGTEEEIQGPEATTSSSLRQAFHSSVHHLEQLRQRFEKVQSAAQALNHFLATVREVKAEIPNLLADQDPSREPNEADREQETRSWQAAMRQRLQLATKQSVSVDSTLKAVGMTLTMDGVAVMCQEVVTSLSQQAANGDEVIRAKKRESKKELFPMRRQQIQELNPSDIRQTNTEVDSTHQGGAQEREYPTPSRMEEEDALMAKRSRLEGDDDIESQREEEHEAQTRKSERDVFKAEDQRRQGSSSQAEKEGAEKESFVQRRVALFSTLKEIREGAEQLRMQEPTLHALQHRTRALTELQSRLAGHLAELQHIQDESSQSGDGSQTREVEDAWEEATKAVTKRLEQCHALTELLKRFQSIRGELSGTLQGAESTISEQASYMGRDKLQRLHTKVQETKAELNGLGDRIEEVRSVCRQLHTHLRHIPECIIIPFEVEADALMDRWLDISERTDSHLENLHRGLTLWDGIIQLGAEVESWTANKLAVFAQSPSFQTEEDIKTLQNEIVTQEEHMERFHQRVTEIPALLQSKEPPLELQVVETQIRKKMKQLKELVSEAEDLYRQMVAAKGQITARMAECFNSLQRIQDSLLTLSASDIAAVLAKLKGLLFELQTQDERAESLLEDVRVMASIVTPEPLQSLSLDGIQLQDKVRNTHQLFSEVEEQTERNIQALDRLQSEGEHLKQWLHGVEGKAAKEEDLSLLQEEALQQRVRTETLNQLVLSLQSSTLKQSALLEESSKLLERYHNFQTSVLRGSTEKQSSPSSVVELFQTQSGVQTRDSPLGANLGIQSPVEQRRHNARAEVSVTAYGEARFEELKVTGNRLSHRLCDGDGVKQDIQGSIQKAQEQRWDLLQPVQSHHRVLQADPDLTSSYLDRRQQASCRVEELQQRTAQLPTLFPWPGLSERRQICHLARQLQDEAESLQLTLSGLAEQKREIAERTSAASWKDPSLAELETCWSSLMDELKGVCSSLEEGVCNEEHFGQSLQDCRHKLTSLQERMSVCQAQKESSAGLVTDAPALEVLLQEVTDMEKELLQIVTLKDSITASSTAEAQTSLSQQVSSLQNHKRALVGSIRGILALLTENNSQRVGRVKEEVSCVQIALKDLAHNLCENSEVLPDISQLKQQLYTIQDYDTRLTELGARVYELQKTGESQEILPADVMLTVDATAKDLDSLTSIFLKKKQACAENTANRVRQVINQLQHWRETVQAELSSPNQAALDEGLWLQRSLRDVLSERDLLLNCLGKQLTKKLETSASDALNESTTVLETLSTCEVSVELKDLPDRVVEETFRSESDAQSLASPDKTQAMCPPASPSAINSQDNSESDHNDNQLKPKDTLETTEEDVSHQFSCAEVKDFFKSPKLTSAPPKINVKTYFVPKDDPGILTTDSNPLSSGLRTLSGINTLMSDSLPTLNESLIARQDNTETFQEDNASTQDSKLSLKDTDNIKASDSAHYVTPLVRSPTTKPDNFRLSTTEIVSQHLAAQLETLKTVPDDQKKEKYCEDIKVRPDDMFTIVLDMETPELQQQDNVGANISDVLTCSQAVKVCDVQITEFSSISEKESAVSTTFTTTPSPELCKTDVKIHFTKIGALNESQVANSLPRNPLALVCTELEEIKSISAKLFCKGRSESQELMHNELLNSSKSSGTVAECQLTGAHAEETTCPDVKQEETSDFCHGEKQAMSSVLGTMEVDASTAAEIPAGDNKQLTVADSAQRAGTGQLEMAEGENTGEGSDPDSPESKLSKVPKRRVKAMLPFVKSHWEVPASLEDTEVKKRQRQTPESMEPERTGPGLALDLPAWEATVRSPECDKHKSTMQDVLSEIQSLVENTNILNRTPHIDLDWYLKSSPGESQIQLVRTVQRVLACRYQPAQLDVTAMAKQLQEAEDHRRCVQEQVATMKCASGSMICDPDALKRVEGQWSAALLDASATVQVKAAQLDQVKEYHKQMKITRAFLEVVAAEKDKMSLSALRSSTLQADKLNALLQTMVQKKERMEKLLQLSSQFSVHLSAAESSGVLLAQLGDVQEEWRLLEGGIKRAVQHASSSTSQSSLLIKEAEQLKAKLDALRQIIFQSHDTKSALELVCLTTDLKLYNQLYLHLQSQTDALVHFSLGQKEKDKLNRSLKELGSLLNVTKSKLDTSAYSCGGISSTKINKQLQDLIIWAKQAEIHITMGKKSALFPEEARIQIVEMRKFQTAIWFKRSKMQVEAEEMKAGVSDMEHEESDQVLKTIEDLYEAISNSLDQVLDTMKKDLQEREKLFSQLASIDVWLAETQAQRDPCAHVDNVSKADIRKLESELKSNKLAAVEIEGQLKRVEAMADTCGEIAVRSSPGESRYLVNRLSGLWTELDWLLAHEKASSWELEELIHELTTSDEELSTIQASLKQTSSYLVQQRFPLPQDTLSTIAQLKHMLMEHECQVQGLKQCQEARRSSLLCTIGELQDQCKALSINAVEQDKYLHLRRQMEESRDIAEEQIQRAKDKTISVDERVMLCQALLVELPLVKTQCQEVADHLEAIAQELEQSALNTEKQRIHHVVETLVSWEHSVTDDTKNLEAKLLLGLHFSSERLALIELFQRTRVELEGLEPVNPNEKAIDIALTKNWIIWRHLESGMRVLEALGQKEKINLKNYKELYSLRDATMQECHLRMESLCQARESLKDYQWAAQGAICFLHNAEATFLSAPGGFLGCAEEQKQTQQALEALEDGFQAHICHLVDLVPQQPCLSRPKTEQLHISILSQLLVGRAILEAQAQLRLESLQRCEVRQQSHRKCHEDIRQRLSGLEVQLSECATEQVTSFDKCIAQQKRATLLMEGLRSLAGKLEELRAGCPVQGCGVGKDGELSALWRRWVSIRRGVGLLMAHTEQRGEEWKDITTSMEQCCSLLASLQSEVPDSSTVSFSQGEPLELLAQAEMHQAGLEQEQQALASLEHRLEHALSLSSSQEPISPGPVGKTLVKIQENVRSLKERNLLVVAAAQAEEKERQQVQVEIAELEQHMSTLLPSLEACSNPYKQQELRKDLTSQKAKLKCIMDGVQSRYAEIPAGISRRLQEFQLTLQKEEEKLMDKSNPVRKLASQVAELGSGLEKVKVLLEQRSPTVNEAQNLLKHVWDELDAWHSRLMLLESEVQDLAEEHPNQAHLLMDQLTQPLQLYQNAAQMTEQRTAFLSKIPACLQEFEDILHGATCWLEEAQSWLSAPCSFPTAKGLQNHANSLQLVLDDSKRIRHALQDFRPVLDEISAVCDISSHEERVDQNNQQVQKMQHKILEPLEQLLQAVGVVEAIEAELKTMEKNVPKIRAILSSMDNSHITLMEHLHNRQVILANMQSMRRSLEEMERCRGELRLPQGAKESLLVFSKTRLLLQPLEELEQLTHQQAVLLENKIREEKETYQDLGVTAVFGSPEEVDQLHRCFVQQEAFEVSNSEEEEDDENKSCHSSSSDTLTSSIPEDPEETLSTSDVQNEGIADIRLLSEVTALESLAGLFSSEVKTSSERAQTTGLLSENPRLHTTESESEHVETGLIAMDSIVGETLSHETEEKTDEDKFTAGAAKLDLHGSTKHKTLVLDSDAKSLQAAAAEEDTRLIPARPKTPFTAIRGSDGSIEEADKHLSLFTAPHQDPERRREVSTSHRGLLEDSHQAQESSEEPISLAGQVEVDEEQIRWSRLHIQISQKLTTLKKVKTEHQICPGDEGTHVKDSESELISTGSASAVLQRTHECIAMMRQIVSSPGVNEGLYEATRKVLLCLDALTDLLLTPGDDDPQLRLLQQECVSTELVTLCELLRKVESGTKPALLRENPEALCCLTSLQDCLQMVKLVSTSSHNQVIEHLGHTYQHQERASNQLCNLDEFELGLSEMFPSIKDAPSLEQCVLGRHQRESPGVKAKLQQASWSLLQGITRLLELGEECITEGQMSRVHNCSQLQAVLCRHKKLLRVLRSQLAFVQHLFQREPKALECQEDERVQLEVRAKTLQQQALEQEVASQRRIQEWTRWEDNCSRLGGLLDDFEAFISSGEPEGDNERLAQHRQAACQQTLVQLDDSRAALGLLLDQGKVLQTDPEFAARVGQAGGALELRWLSAYRRTEQESRRCRDIQDSQDRFQTDFSSVREWLVGANKKQKMWSNLADTSDLNQECICNNLIELLDFYVEIEAMSVQRASASREATKLLHLREADCPGLRAQLTQQEGSWTRLTSDLSSVQDRLQQRLLAAWPPVKLLPDLEDWLKKLEARLNQEKETVLKAKDAAQITELLQHYQELKTGIVNGLLLLDFLCQSGPQAKGLDIRALQSERTMFAEKLGALRRQWLHLQRALESETREAEQMRHTCADRERRLQRLHSWTEQQKKQLSQWKQPTSQTGAREALLELEAAVSRVKEASAALQELKLMRVHVEKDEDHPCDISFSGWTESVCHACVDLSKQMEALQPALQQNVEEWSCFESDLRVVSVHTTRVRCALQHQPLFSLKQAEGHVDLLEHIQEKARKGETLWASVDKSYQSLVKTLHRGTAKALEDQMSGERKRWKDAVQELKSERMRTEETISLWQEYTHLSDRCSLHLQTLGHQWEELSRSSPRPETQAKVQSVEKLQNAAEDLQSSVGDVLLACKPLTERLEPLATSLIQSETRLLSRDVLLLNKSISGTKRSLQEDLEQQKLFHSGLEALDKQTQSTQDKCLTRFDDTDSMKEVLLELSDLFPSLVEVREMSCYVTLNSHETERLHMLSKQWVESMTRTSDKNRELQAERQRSQTFSEKCKSLTSIQKKLEEDSMPQKIQSFSSLRDMLSVHKRLETEIMIGHQLVQGLLRHAVESMETETGEKRSELMAQVTRMRISWLNSLALAGQRRSLTKEQLGQWRVYHHGSKRLWRLLREVDPLLPPAGPAQCALHQRRSCADDYQCVKDALGLHSTVYSQTLGAGRHLCETMTESECQSQLQSELQAIQEAWERSTSLLESRGDLVSTAVQKWTQCQDAVTDITSELDELNTTLKQPLPERSQDSAQETDLLLQRLTGGFRELATMKTDLSQYVAAGDSALLEQQLEQLHGQWEELCMKVSLRRQEIADRLNAWTIFNDKNKEFCDWLTQMENKVCHNGELSIEEMVEKLKKDCMEEINLFSENKSHLKHLGEQLLLASDEAKQTKVHGSLQEVNQRWHNLFHQIEVRVKKLKETLVAVQQLDKNMSNLRSWLSRIESELSRPVTYSVCHHQEIQRRLAEQQELQRDIEQHTQGVVSVLSLCDVLLRDEDAAGGTEPESDSLQETSHSLDQRWRAICAMALDRRLRIEETWRLWCKFLDDYSRFEDWLKMAERTAANPNSADVLYTVAKEELKKFEGFQRQVHERLTQLELVNNQYRRLARENRTDRASQLKVMVHEGNRRWDNLHRRVAAILRRLKYFTSQREEFEGTRESMLVWLTELDLQLTNVEHFSESDVHHKIQQLNSFQKEITLNTERIDGLIVFGEGLIQKSSLQDAALIEDELEELHSYCQEVFSRLVRFHQRLSQPPTIREEPELSDTAISLASSLELIGRPWLGRSQGSLPATPTRLLASPLERSGRETPVSVDSLPLEWDHTGDVGGSSSHEDEEEEEEHEDDRTYFSALSASGRSMSGHESPTWRSQGDTETQLDSDEALLTSTPLKKGYLRLMSECSGSIEDIKRVSLILDDEEQPEDLGLTGLTASDKQSGVIERWELLQAQSRSPQEARHLTSVLDDITSWLEKVTPELERHQQSDPAASIEDMAARATELKEMQRTFTRYKSTMLSVNLRAQEATEQQERLAGMNHDWGRACTGLQQWDTSLRKTLMRCQEFHETLHSLLLWLAHAESRRYAVDISDPATPVPALQQHLSTLTELQKELRGRQTQQASVQALWSQLQPEDEADEADEAKEKLHVTSRKLKMLLRQVDQDLSTLQQRLDCETASDVQDRSTAADPKTGSSPQREKKGAPPPPRSFFYRVLRAAFPLHLFLLFLLLLPCLIPQSESDPGCTGANNFARSFYPMLRYTNGPPPT
ncbi:nesprin-2a [Clinocottus analis]|uniref:nesprin-2a n=1 Tax=Clinocottus analis TaxID=304258 RepID=UPI0035BFB25D